LTGAAAAVGGFGCREQNAAAGGRNSSHTITLQRTVQIIAYIVIA
jgi:hypothetical protein